MRRGWWRRVLALALVGLASGCGAGAPERPAVPIVLVVVDTLRADHLSCYGYELPTSPAIDAFAGEATLFEHNTTQCNSTFPSLTSILTGLYPKTHRNYLAVPVQGTVGSTDGAACLAERLKEVGYHTVATISHPSWKDADENATVLRGWDEISFLEGPGDLMERVRLANAAYTNERLFAQLERYEREARDRPLFAWVHYFDPHTDLPNVYDAPRETRNRFLAPHLAQDGLGRYYRALAALSPAERPRWIAANVPAGVAREVTLANGRSLYDAEIAFCDQAIGALFERLRSMGLWDDALVVVMADHGENLEGADAGHGSLAFTHKKLYEAVAHTPLIVKLPGQRESARVDALTQNVDLVPTLIELLGLQPGAPVEGRSLVSLLRGASREIHDAVFIESSDYVDRALKTRDLKYVDRGEGEPPLVFAWREDREEREDLAASLEPERLDALRARMTEFRPVDVLHVALEPGSAPWEVEIELELERGLVDGINDLAGAALDHDGRRFRWSATVAGEPLHAELALRRRNCAMRWRLRAPDGALLAGRVFLGRAPLASTTAIPLWRAGAGAVPAEPSLTLDTRAAERGEIALGLAGAEGARLDVELRFAHPDYEKTIVVAESSGFGALHEGRSRVFQLAGTGPRASARCTWTKLGETPWVLARVDGRWPEASSVLVDGAPAAQDALEFVFPHPLDGRITTDLMSGRGTPAPGSITIWLEASGGGARIDAARMDDLEHSLLEQLGYAGDDAEHELAEDER